MGLTAEQRAKLVAMREEYIRGERERERKDNEEYEDLLSKIKPILAGKRHLAVRYFEEVTKIQNDWKRQQEEFLAYLEDREAKGEYGVEITDNKREFEALPLYSDDVLDKYTDISCRMECEDVIKYPLDEIEEYYFCCEEHSFAPDVDGVIVREDRLARLLYLTQNTIRNYKKHNIIKPVATDKAKSNPDGERRYYDIGKALRAIQEYKNNCTRRRKSEIAEIRNTNRNNKGKFTKTDDSK